MFGQLPAGLGFDVMYESDSVLLEVVAAQLPCDFNADSNCDLADINQLFSQGNLVTGVAVAASSPFDLNADLSVDNTDLDLWLADSATVHGFGAPFRRGDTDDIGPGTVRDVDITDFNALATNFSPVGDGDPTNGPFWNEGNFDGDEDIDITDFNFLASNFAPTGYGASSAIPEPSSLVLHLLGFVGVASFIRRIHRLT